jgi:hypothetical protein
VKFSDDVQIVPNCRPTPGVWEYTAEDMHNALVDICHRSQEVAERLIVEAQADVDKVRASFAGRAVGAKEVNIIIGPPKDSASSVARAYVIRSQESKNLESEKDRGERQ